MQERIEDILKKYWGYHTFRPLQEDIISSILKRHDTLALLPTGGGKSLCFQVPAMAMEGTCLVISPLIALMQDQVNGLRKKGIKAIAINSSLSRSEVDRYLDEVVFGDVKFLYLSPERIETELFLARLPKMKISLIAVDEAHCISEWGFDFRPAYRKIAALREQLPKVPLAALTATATPDVVDDIKNQLKFDGESKTFQGSFLRKNLIYVLQEEKNKLARTLSIIKSIGGTGIVYVRSRRESLRQANLLRANGFAALPYHAGMTFRERKDVQEAWIKDKAQIVVATNAFGMGIDKANVRYVVHLSLPQSIEAYFQEAGRAGRDGKLAYAICLVDETDREYLTERIDEQVPNPDLARSVHRALSNHFQLAVGSGFSEGKPFELQEFAKKYNFKALEVYNALKLLEMNNYLYLSDAVLKPSQMKFILKSKDLYNFEIRHPRYEALIHLLLRTFEGVFDHPVRIDENQLAIHLKTSPDSIKDQLRQLEEFRVLEYRPQTSLPLLSFPESRKHNDSVHFDHEFISRETKRIRSRGNAMLLYSKNDVVCRSIQLLQYFGENSIHRCGKCDVCISSKQDSTNIDQKIISLLETKLKDKNLSLDEILAIKEYKNTNLAASIRWMIENGVAHFNSSNKFELYSKAN